MTAGCLQRVEEPPAWDGDASLRVLHCIPALSLGGAQRVMIELIRHLQPVGVASKIVVLGGEQTAVDWPNLPVTPQFLGFDGGSRKLAERKYAISAIQCILENERIDIVHSHLWGAALLADAAASLRHVPHLVHIHDTRPWVRGRNLRSLARRWWVRRRLRGGDAAFVSVSQAAWQYNSEPLELCGRQFEIIPNGVNTVEFRPRITQTDPADGTDVVRIGVVARFSPEKGHLNLIRAAATLRDEGLAISLHLAGTGSMLEECQQLVRKVGLDETVTFHGLTEDVPGFLQSLDIFVLPSLSCEGMPLSVLEAMAVGIPVVATDVGGTREVVSNGVTGLLAPPNDVHALATALRELILDRNKCRQLSSRAANLIRRDHQWQSIAASFATLYGSMMSRPAENRS